MCIYVFALSVRVRVCRWESELERERERERGDEVISAKDYRPWSRVGGGCCRAATIYTLCANSVNNRVWINFFRTYNIVHFYIFLYSTRDHERSAVNDPSHPPTGVGLFFRLSYNISHYYRYIKRYVVSIFHPQVLEIVTIPLRCRIITIYIRALVFGHFNACPAEVDLV